MAPKFEIFQPKPDEFRWVLSNQGRVLARSGSYTRKATCVKGMESFRAAAPTADIVDAATADVTFASPAGIRGRAARTSGRVVGKASAKVADVPSLARTAVHKVVGAVSPSPRKRTRKT